MGARESKLRKLVSGGSGSPYYKRIQGPMLLVPRGYVPICVGTNEETCKRFMIHTRALGDVFFRELLVKSEEVYGFRNEGVLRIPFEAQEFEEWFNGRSNKIKIKRMVIPI
ncbi:putative small auxin-up RNA [Medicago truncatula]|uniref:Putative small auxin-up RNA n=1 Tax=Medicago truncatula TaxID=3880 RepID=G7L8D4_MEDTR|nr:SAUR-like auxin-responsive family protein [Medicago truncatula]RHN39525.1 putative small auxin-up RNA [Medicago truncatula]